MQIVEVVVLISLAEWYATLGPHLFHFKSLGLLAGSLENGDAAIAIYITIYMLLEYMLQLTLVMT